MERIFLPFPREQGQPETAQLFETVLIPCSGEQVLFSTLHKNWSQQLFSLFPQGIPILSGSTTICSRAKAVFNIGIGLSYMVSSRFLCLGISLLLCNLWRSSKTKRALLFLDNLFPLVSELVIKAMLVMASTAYSVTKESIRGWSCPFSMLISLYFLKKRGIPHPPKRSFSTQDDVLTPS